MPGAARFLTRDTLSPNAGGTQGYNGYAYANGNPVTLTDPSGHSAIGGLKGIGEWVRNAFLLIAMLFDYFLFGEGRYGREHGDDGGWPGGPGGGDGGSSGGARGIATICRPLPEVPCDGELPAWPPIPSAGDGFFQRPYPDPGQGGGGGVGGGDVIGHIIGEIWCGIFGCDDDDRFYVFRRGRTWQAKDFQVAPKDDGRLSTWDTVDNPAAGWQRRDNCAKIDAAALADQYGKDRIDRDGGKTIFNNYLNQYQTMPPGHVSILDLTGEQIQPFAVTGGKWPECDTPATDLDPERRLS